MLSMHGWHTQVHSVAGGMMAPTSWIEPSPQGYGHPKSLLGWGYPHHMIVTSTQVCILCLVHSPLGEQSNRRVIVCLALANDTLGDFVLECLGTDSS